MSLSVPAATTRLWRCPECNAEERQDASRMIPPQCGKTTTEHHTFPNGHMTIIQYSKHPDKVEVLDSEEHRFHPALTEIAEEVRADRIEAMKAAAERSVAAANERAGITDA